MVALNQSAPVRVNPWFPPLRCDSSFSVDSGTSLELSSLSMEEQEYPDKQELQAAYEKRLHRYEALLDELVRRLGKELKREGLRFSLKQRVKSFPSYYAKLLKRNGNTNPIQDLLGIRIVSPFLENLRSIEEFLRSRYTVREVERKGAEHSFREFGYQSVHLLIELPRELIDEYPGLEIDLCEVQIRTILQDAWSEVEHELVYKSGFTPYDESLRRKLAALNANLTLSDVIFQEIRDYQRSLHAELERRRRSFLELIEDEPVKLPDPQSSGGEAKDYTASTIDELLLDALSAHNRGEFKAAISLYDMILERPIEAKVRSVITIHRGMALFAAARYADALADFLQAAELEPENGKVCYYQGIVHRVMSRKREALKAFRRSLELDPYQFESLFSLARMEFDLGDAPAALELCEKALKLAPEEAKLIEFRSYVAASMGL